MTQYAYLLYGLFGVSQTLTYRIDLAIARSIWRGLSLRFSLNDLTLGNQVVLNKLELEPPKQ